MSIFKIYAYLTQTNTHTYSYYSHMKREIDAWQDFKWSEVAESEKGDIVVEFEGVMLLVKFSLFFLFK